MKNRTKAALALCMIATVTTSAFAESSIQYYGMKKPFDAKIEAAAIEKAASKIGELRGSIDGSHDGYLITLDDLDKKRTSALGFPILREQPVQRKVSDSVPIV